MADEMVIDDMEDNEAVEAVQLDENIYPPPPPEDR